MESNDSPEIPDWGGDIRHPRPPFGGTVKSLQMQKDVVLKKVLLSFTVLSKNVSPPSISMLMTKTTYLSGDMV